MWGQSQVRINFVGIGCALLWALQSVSAFSQESHSDVEVKILREIVDCLADRKEAVLQRDGPPQCEKYRNGAASFSRLQETDPRLPSNVDVNEVCVPDRNDQRISSPDQRKLPPDAIKWIASQNDGSVDPFGIRIVGAIFCDRLNLAGLDLKYSLVMDFSIFREGIEARNFRTLGDVSFDRSLILGIFAIARSRVDGTIFANGSRADTLSLADSVIQGSVLFRNSTFSGPAIFDTVSIGGELSIRQATFPYFLFQYGKVGGVLDLTQSQALCAYLIRKSEIKDVVAVDFGSQEPQAAGGLEQPLNTSTAGPGCRYPAIATPGTFLVSDTQVSSSVCIRSFHWLPPDAEDASFLSLHDLSVNKTTFIDLASNTDRHDQTPNRTHKFEAIGLETHSLIFNFGSYASYANWVNGIKFEHVYTAENITCGYDPSFGDSKNHSKSLLEAGRGAGATLHLPRVGEVVAWLNSNSIATTQPSEVFVAAFQKEGEADSAKEVRIARAARELAATWERVSKEFHDIINRPLGTQPISSGGIVTSPNLGSSIFDLAADGVAAVFGSLLSHVADYGYRPEKVIWIFVGTIFASILYFWFFLRVVGIAPEKKSDTIRPIGVAFVFDRLLPLYRIRESHFKIDSYYKRITRRQLKRQAFSPEAIRTLKYLWTEIPVVKVSDDEVRRIEVRLGIIEAIGLSLAVFLVATINALVSH